MTTVSSSTSTLKTLMALYENENSSAGGNGKLTKDQVATVENMLQGGSSADSGVSGSVDALLGSSTTTSSDLSSILDAMKARAGTADSTTSATAATPQQQAVTLMQNIYQSQQNNLFTLIG